MKKYVISDIHEEINKFEKSFKPFVKPEDIIYILGDICFNSGRNKSKKSILYFWNLTQQTNIPTIKILKGNHEWKGFLWEEDFKNNHFNVEYINELILEDKLTWYSQEVKLPTEKELLKWINELPLIIEEEHFLMVHGWYNPNWSLERNKELNNNEEKPVYKEFSYYPSNCLWGSPALILLCYKEYCKQFSLKDCKETMNKFKNEDEKFKYDYYGFKTIEDYNETIKNKLNKIVICGHWFDPLFKNSLEVVQFSNLLMIDGGIGYGGLENEHYCFKKEDEKINIIDITNHNEIKIIKGVENGTRKINKNNL
ncbi:MAG: hypothetical protein ACRC4M_03245 [Mycoplasma sp.]